MKLRRSKPIWWRARKNPAESANRACPAPLPPFATPYLRPPVSGFGGCPSAWRRQYELAANLVAIPARLNHGRSLSLGYCYLAFRTHRRRAPIGCGEWRRSFIHRLGTCAAPSALHELSFAGGLAPPGI